MASAVLLPISRPFWRLSAPLLSRRNPAAGYPRGRARALVALAGGGGDEPAQKVAAGGDDGKEQQQRRPVLNLSWRDLLAPDPDNVLAVALTGVLAWASLQALWQLFLISAAILLAALKYSFIAALLLFILITLL